MELSKIRDSSISLYYGKEHFTVKFVKILTDSLGKGEKCLCYMGGVLEEGVVRFIDDDYIKSKRIEFHSIEDLIRVYNGSEINKLKDKVSDMVNNLSQGGYTIARLIVDSNSLIEKMTKDRYLEFESNLSRLLATSNISVVFAYDITLLVDSKEKDLLDFKDILKSSMTNKPINQPDYQH